MARSRSKSVEAIDMLKQDHDKVEKAFKDFEKMDREDMEACRRLIMAVCEQLENMQDDDPNFHATFTVLGEYVRHHVKEEEGEMFPAAKKSALDFDSLAERMRERRQELLGEMEKAHA